MIATSGKTRFRTGAGLLGLGLLAATPCIAQTTLSMSSWVPPSHSVTRTMVAWGQEVERASNGRVKTTLLPKAVVAPPGTFDAVRDGLVDVSFTTHGYTPGRFVLTKIAEFPFLGDSAETMSVAYNRIYDKDLAKGGEHKGVKVLTMFTHGPGEMYNTKKPITQIADLAGMKIRVGGGVVNDVANALGVNSLLKPAPESYELLSSGVADGTFFPAESIASFKLEKVIKYATHVPGGLYNTSFAMFMNEDRFSKLSKQDQDAIMSVSGEHLARMLGKSWDAADKAGIDAMKAAGIPIVNASPALVKEIRDKTGGLEQAWVKEANAKGIDAARAMAEFREEIKRVSSGK